MGDDGPSGAPTGGASVGTAAAARAGQAAIGPTVGAGATRPLNTFIRGLESSNARSFARRYRRVLTSGGNVANARQFGADAGISATRINEIETAINEISSRQVNRTRGANR